MRRVLPVLGQVLRPELNATIASCCCCIFGTIFCEREARIALTSQPVQRTSPENHDATQNRTALPLNFRYNIARWGLTR